MLVSRSRRSCRRHHFSLCPSICHYPDPIRVLFFHLGFGFPLPLAVLSLPLIFWSRTPGVLAILMFGSHLVRLPLGRFAARRFSHLVFIIPRFDFPLPVRVRVSRSVQILLLGQVLILVLSFAAGPYARLRFPRSHFPLSFYSE
jgi:hypothetical protein